LSLLVAVAVVSVDHARPRPRAMSERFTGKVTMVAFTNGRVGLA
jgi:hypothetical protein